MFKVARMYILADEEDSFISDFCSCTEAEQIALLDTFCFFSRVDNNTEKEKLFKKIWSILLLLEVSESEKIRFLVSVVYANLYETQICDKALNRLISMLDDGSSDMKIGAISRLKAKNASGTLVDYIYQQGRVDNNYCVREIANR